MRKILSVSLNTRLLVTRNDVLAVAGYSVASPKAPEEAPLLLMQGEYAAVVIGHSVPPDVLRELIPRLRQANGEIPIVFVYQADESLDEPLADVSIDVTDPLALVKKLESLNRRKVGGE